MSMNTTPVELFIIKIGADVVNRTKRKWFIKTNLPSLYDEILTTTVHLQCTTFVEQLYCFCNNITEMRLCKKCSSRVTFSKQTKEYCRYCSQRCAILDMGTLLGCENTSQLPSVKLKKKQKSLEKYGVDNVSKSPEVKQLISQRKTDYWNKIYENKTYTIDGLTKEQYRHRSQQYADTQYARHKHILDPDNLRSKDCHLDHIYSVSNGFINDVPVNIISDISNLRMIPATENYAKHRSSYKTLRELYEDCSSFIPACNESSFRTAQQ